MPRRVENITDEPIQRHQVQAEGITVTLTLRFLPQVSAWFIDVQASGRERYGIRLAINTLHIESANMPADIVVRDTSDLGIDPARRDDFSTGRCQLWVMMPADMEEIRGAPVPIRS